MLFLLSFIFLRGEGSTNGKLYVCDGQTTTEAAGTYCVFAIDESECSTDDSLDCLTAPLEGNSLVDITQQGLGGAMVAGSNGMQMGVSPRPWTEGDQLVTAPSAVSGDDWANALAFSMVAPLRNKMMMTPWEVYPQDQWELYTNAFTDCMIKLVDGEANDLSSTNVHAQLNQATDGGPVHTPLQYLEEAAIDLVCLMTDLDMSGSRRLLSDDRCAAIREVWGIQSGTRCDCWTDAYVAMFGSEPEVEQGFFSDCSVVGTPTVPTETDSGSDDSDSGTGGGSTSGPTCCDGSTAACADGSSMPCSSGAPVCADGSNALQPGTECPSDDPG